MAQQLWGDASLWYKLAEANGLQGDATLTEGQHLTVPAGVSRSSYNASTLKPYDADSAIGNLSPTTAKPKHHHHCGVFGQILLAVVAIAVTAVLKVPLTGLLGGNAVVGAAAAGAAGSIASQTVGVATGIQDKFSFSAVALSAISAGVGEGVNVVGISSPFLTNVANGVVRSAITQGIGVATGLQSRFDWTGIAAAGIGAGAFGTVAGSSFARSPGPIAGNTLASTASALANAATRSIANGSDFGDNVMAALPDVIANTVGNLVASGISDSSGNSAAQGGRCRPVATGTALRTAR